MNYKDLPKIKTKIEYLEISVENWGRQIKNIERFQPDSSLVRDYTKHQADAIEEIRKLQQQREDIIAEMDMNERTKAVLLMHYDAGMKWQEIADREGVSIRQIHRIRKQV